VSEVAERLWAEYEGFSQRDLYEHAIVYLFVDGAAERLRPGEQCEAAPAAGASARTDARSCWC
jgi:hypothetical protein